MASPLIGIAGVNSLLFAAYGASRRIISPFPQLSLGETALAGSMAGLANAVLASPGTCLSIYPPYLLPSPYPSHFYVPLRFVSRICWLRLRLRVLTRLCVVVAQWRCSRCACRASTVPVQISGFGSWWVRCGPSGDFDVESCVDIGWAFFPSFLSGLPPLFTLLIIVASRNIDIQVKVTVAREIPAYAGYVSHFLSFFA